MKTNDLEKMRQELEKKLMYAQMENELNARAGFDWGAVKIIGESCTQSGKLQTTIWRDGYGHDGLTAAQVCEVLNTFPQTERSRVYIGLGKYDKLSYIFETERTPGHATILHLSYISDNLDLSLNMAIDPNDEDTTQFFRLTARELSDTEINLYLDGRRTKYNYNTRHNFQYYTFNLGKVVKFQGGRDRQVSEAAATTIAANLWCRASE